MQSPWTIIFDFGNTLAPFNDREATAITADIARYAAGRTGLYADEFAALWLEERDADFRASAISGVEHDFGARLARVLARARLAADQALCADVEACAVESFVRHVRVDAEVRAALNELTTRHTLGLLSNYLLAAPIHGVLRRDGVHHLFEKVIVSKEVGFAKPHGRCFQAMVEALECSPNRTVYVGDDFAADVEGATRAGLRVAWTLAMREPSPEVPDTLPVGVHCLRNRREYLAFLRDPEAVLDARVSGALWAR